MAKDFQKAAESDSQTILPEKADPLSAVSAPPDAQVESSQVENASVEAGVSPITCPECGNDSPMDATFCDQCGALLGHTTSTHATRPSLNPADTGVQPPSFVVVETQERVLFPSNKNELLVGRQDSVSNVFPDIDLEPFGAEVNGVSRRHARLKRHGTQWQIEDLNSTNFSYINKKRLAPGEPHPLNDGDLVRLGGLTLAFFQG